ncbi:hypothetical protein C8J57DRAFT_1227247 [Mycena rebaudengoi]|nr:hypothetical protein C8J57DRAFT_1227247 [Mycena rebaudengoi]
MQTERPYQESDFIGLSQDKLVNLIEREHRKWPGTQSQLSKANMEHLRRTLLDPSHGFTCSVSLPLPPSINADVVTAALPNSIGVFQYSRPYAGMENGTLKRSDIFATIQASINKLQGSGRIGVPDRQDSSYTEHFVKFTADEDISSPDPAYLIITDSTLHLRIDRIALKQERTPKEDILDLNTSSSSSDPVAPATHSAGKQDQTTPKELAWLREKNTTMHQILCLPSKPGEGVNYSPEVVSEIGKSDETPPPGAGRLKTFLQAWQKEHLVNGTSI